MSERALACGCCMFLLHHLSIHAFTDTVLELDVDQTQFGTRVDNIKINYLLMMLQSLSDTGDSSGASPGTT